ncbi:unnamed protein product, partial [Arabidopsis halleri]
YDFFSSPFFFGNNFSSPWSYVVFVQGKSNGGGGSRKNKCRSGSAKAIVHLCHLCHSRNLMEEMTAEPNRRWRERCAREI